MTEALGAVETLQAEIQDCLAEGRVAKAGHLSFLLGDALAEGEQPAAAETAYRTAVMYAR